MERYCADVKFQFVTFENTPENARQVLKKLGQNIDMVAGMFDSDYLRDRGCRALELSREPIRCAVSIYHPLAVKSSLTVEDLYGETLFMIRRGWNSYMDMLRDDMEKNHPKVRIKDFEFFNVSVFNQCQNGNDILITIDHWKSVHPLLKVLPVEWDYRVPFGLMHSPKPSPLIKRFLSALEKVLAEKLDKDPAVLRATYDRYQEQCANGKDEGFGKDASHLVAYDGAGGFYGAYLQAASWGTIGGALTDRQFHVLDTNDAPIENLFAVGESATSTLFGDYYLGGFSLGYYSAAGRIAAQTAVEEINGAD